MTHTVNLLTPQQAQARRDALVDLLVDTVEGGASVNFVWPMTRTKAESWWEGALASHARRKRLIFTAEAEDRLDGTVQLILAPQENQAFRADLAKLLVHRRARHQGLGAALIRAAQDEARRIGRTLLTLDTETGSAAERLYTRLGWTKYGEGSGLCDESRQPLARCRELLLQDALTAISAAHLIHVRAARIRSVGRSVLRWFCYSQAGLEKAGGRG